MDKCGAVGIYGFEKNVSMVKRKAKEGEKFGVLGFSYSILVIW